METKIFATLLRISSKKVLEKQISFLYFLTKICLGVHSNNTLSKLSSDIRFQCAFTACVFKELTLVGSNQRNYFENTNIFHKKHYYLSSIKKVLTQKCKILKNDCLLCYSKTLCVITLKTQMHAVNAR